MVLLLSILFHYSVILSCFGGIYKTDGKLYVILGYIAKAAGVWGLLFYRFHGRMKLCRRKKEIRPENNRTDGELRFLRRKKAAAFCQFRWLNGGDAYEG